jgi:putative nucleotidyltransferase with HDIG domain
MTSKKSKKTKSVYIDQITLGLTKRLPHFVKDPRFQKWAIVITLAAALSLLLTPQRYFSYPEHRVGSIAIRDIKADRDFLVEDRVSTEQKKLDASREMRSVYDFDSELPLQLRSLVTKTFSSAAQSFSKLQSGDIPKSGIPNVLKKIKTDFENSLEISLSDDEFTYLQKNKFSPDLSDGISKILTSLYTSELISNVILPKHDLENGIMIRDIKTQQERSEKNLKYVRHVNTIDPYLRKKAAPILSDERDDVKRAVLSLTKKMIRPNLTFNRNATERKRNEAIQDIKPMYFQVQKDEMIVREGQKITDNDLDKLSAYFRMTGEKQFSNISIFSGIFFLVITLSITLYFISRNWFKAEPKTSDLLFLGIVALLQIILVKSGIFMSHAVHRAFSFLPAEAFLYAAPYAVGAMLVGVLINRNIAFVFSIFSSVLVAFLFDGKTSLILYSLIGSVFASYHIVLCKQRSSYVTVGLYLGALNCSVICFIVFTSPTLSLISIDTLIGFILGFTGGLFSGVIVAGITPLFEALFHYTTDIKLLELANLNQPIFQKMIVEAPGTYHHSIIVASLVEAAAETVGANPLLAKVSAYYHDIGKIKKPEYFIENQRNGENKHNKLTPKMSSLIIISHVKEGFELANKVKLGTQITNIIKEHHGTSLVSYFYEKAKKDKDPSIRSLPEEDFRYPGPKPQSKEAGLVLLGDVMEASSRTLTNPTPSRIRNLVDGRIERVFLDGQLDECELTLRDLHKIAECFTRILNGIFHHRIDYPEPVIREFIALRKENNGGIDRKSSERNKRRSSTGPAGSQ